MELILENTAKQLARQVECAKQAGMYDAMFISFGTLLGYVRYGTIIPHDNDLDIGFISEMITAEQENEYLRLMREPTDVFPEHGLGECRWELNRRDDNSRLFWVSVRGLPDDVCFKCCHWFFWTQQGYTWHCKGRGALVKGLPAGYLELGPEVEFLGVTVRIPRFTGSAMDFWYTDWGTPRVGGNSAKKVLFEVADWAKMSGNVRVRRAE
jgi:hypothetical protein